MASSERAAKRPRTDSVESDDAGRSEKLITEALDYLRAWEKRGDGSDWKFRKATQSFLLSALWRADVIPKTYFDIALQYLQGIQGRARDRLVQQASEHLSAGQCRPSSSAMALAMRSAWLSATASEPWTAPQSVPLSAVR